MRRTIASILSATALCAATAADACSCVPYPTQAEADRAGERVYASADLIVDATVGDVSERFKASCRGAGSRPDPATIGRKISGDRPFTIHHVLKGRAPARPILAGGDGEIYAGGCGVMTNSCDVDVASNSRTILVLHRVSGARYVMENVCSLMALRQSRRGQALFRTRG